MARCRKCGDTGWVAMDLKSDALHSVMLQLGVDAEIACTECHAGKAELEKAQREADDSK